MDCSKYLIWWIPSGKDASHHLEEKVYAKEYMLGMSSEDHRDLCKNFILEHHLDHKGRGEGHFDYAETLLENGIAVAFQSGRSVDGKYFTIICLPEEITPFMKEFLESQKAIFASKFHTSSQMFQVFQYSKEPVNYRSISSHLKDGKIEAIIQNKPYQNGQELLYDWMENQELKR